MLNVLVHFKISLSIIYSPPMLSCILTSASSQQFLTVLFVGTDPWLTHVKDPLVSNFKVVSLSSQMPFAECPMKSLKGSKLVKVLKNNGHIFLSLVLIPKYYFLKISTKCVKFLFFLFSIWKGEKMTITHLFVHEYLIKPLIVYFV